MSSNWIELKVIEARHLQELSTGRLESVYCTVSLRNSNDNFNISKIFENTVNSIGNILSINPNHKHLSAVCDKTRDPLWVSSSSSSSSSNSCSYYGYYFYYFYFYCYGCCYTHISYVSSSCF